jgi:cell division protein FtsI (penicillin-binding protein 3)
VSPDGTARRAALRGVRVAGKTGTAQKFDPKSGTYSTDRFTAWFIGIVPADAPKLVIVAGVDEPRRPQHTGGAAAAPLFARVATAQLARFGIFTEPTSGVAPIPPAAPPATRIAAATGVAPIAPATPAVASAPPNRSEARPPPAESTGSRAAAQPTRDDAPLVRIGNRMLLPDFHGLTESEVRTITADTPLDVKATGRGRAVSQVPPAGTILASGQALVLIHFEQNASDNEGGEG